MGPQGRGNALVTTYGYDTNTGGLVSIDYSDPDTPDISHTYGRSGERVRTVDGSGSIDYGYNDALQLQTEIHARSNGTHVITRTHESDGTGTVAGRLSGVRLQSPGAPAYRLDYGYDAFGRHSTFTSHHGDTQRTATYGWIPGSHLLAGIDHGGLLHTTYRYEPHRDVKTTVSNWVAGVGGQPNRNLSTYAHDYSPDRRRVNVVNTGEAFAQAAFNLFDYNARNEVVRSLRHPGSDTTQTNNEVVAEARRYEYDPIGNTLRATGPAATLCKFRFSTKYQCGKFGVAYYGYRYYGVAGSRWLNRDPIEEYGGLNIYAFVMNDSNNRVDRLGLDEIPLPPSGNDEQPAPGEYLE